MARIKEFQDDGRTILFVTHSSDLVRQICDFAVVLSSGDMIGSGPAADAVRIYHEHLNTVASGIGAAALEAEEAPAPAPLHRSIEITSVDVEHPGVGAAPLSAPVGGPHGARGLRGDRTRRRRGVRIWRSTTRKAD